MAVYVERVGWKIKKRLFGKCVLECFFRILLYVVIREQSSNSIKKEAKDKKKKRKIFGNVSVVNFWIGKKYLIFNFVKPHVVLVFVSDKKKFYKTFFYFPD